MFLVSRISLRGIFFTLLATLSLLYFMHFYGILQSERVDIMVDKVSQVKIPWTYGTSIGDSFRNSELTLTNHKRQQAVRNAMQHAWAGYKTHAFGKDELQPISKGGNVRWGDWAISLIDSLDTLKLMEMEEEYLEAKEFVRSMDFGRVTSGYMTQVFEMTIRALGGLLGAYELDEDPMLLKKAREVADVLAVAFEGSLVGLPVSYVDVNMKKPVPTAQVCIAEAGTIQLEFKKLSQLTGDPKYRKIVERASDVLETATKYHSGLYPMYLNTVNGQYDHSASLSIGAGADSFYEYQLKQYILHDKAEEKYKDQYVASVEAVKAKLVAKSDSGLLYLGQWRNNMTVFVREMEHLACFYPGLMALGAQVLDRPQDLTVAEELARTCYLSYKTTATGLGPETFSFSEPGQLPPAIDDISDDILPVAAPLGYPKIFQPNKYGITPVDTRYILRPETVESLFILYRVTDDPKYQEWGWDIFNAIEKHTKAEVGYAAYVNVHDVNSTGNWIDSMESFFMAETLKYLYLLFSPTDLISLDEFVLSTEAHPFRIIKNNETVLAD
ncbi:hypothetical protein LPJ66_004309 [Kickxella alabastrina]|uniref:Uncharacterized protein n=1 Tax=Kickxella alabastrina TaxID=61397 RepID=A0ACC1IMX8_9FUNG|nr:hypothetical protein LPJ66_004309 [Kickxella alabastrina]